MKNKRTTTKRLLLVLFIVYGQVGFAQNFTYKSKINSIAKNAFYKVLLSSELSAHSSNHLEDLRIIDNTGKEIPYLLTKETSYSSKSNFIQYTILENKNDNQWQKLRMVMVHSTEIYIPLDINQSPLNVGLRIELQPFSGDQVLDLAVRHGLHLTEQQLSQLMVLVGGHPYLIRQALYQLRKQTLAWDELLSTAATDAGIYMDHLRRHFNHLQRDPELAEAFIEVLKSDRPVTLNPIHLFKLNSLGLVTLIGNQAKIGCELYQYYFSDRLGLGSIPAAHPL